VPDLLAIREREGKRKVAAFLISSGGWGGGRRLEGGGKKEAAHRFQILGRKGGARTTEKVRKKGTEEAARRDPF